VEPDLSRPRSRCGLLPALTASPSRCRRRSQCRHRTPGGGFRRRVNGNRISEQLRIRNDNAATIIGSDCRGARLDVFDRSLKLFEDNLVVEPERLSQENQDTS